MLILIVDDETGMRESVGQALQKGNEIRLCAAGGEALGLLEKCAVDLVITDNKMPGMDGLELIRRGRALSPGTAFFLMTGFGTVEDAVKAMRLGAEDYFTKPFDLQELRHRVQRLEDLRSWKAEAALKASTHGGPDLIGASAALEQVRHFVQQVAAAPSPVLLLGPSGVGKEIIAQSIHRSGPRAVRPFVAINCASLSEQLMESELFGHEKGAFTGASAAKPGKFELASGGSLFLDEVGELGANLQAKLLRVLQENEFCRVGGMKVIRSNARVIAATHRPLKEMVANGSFREDLYFRLDVLSCKIPPLSERPEDIPPLLLFYWGKLTRELGIKAELEPSALARLRAYHYPGNVRELRNVLERLIVLAGPGGTIGTESLPAEFLETRPPATGPRSATGSGRGLEEDVAAFEWSLIEAAMRETGGNQLRAAERLGITRTTLQYKLKKYGYRAEKKAA